MTIESLESRQLFTAYFVDASRGNDSLSGRSARAAWQTLAALNDRSFRPGDRILLTGTFSGQTLSLGPNAAGVSVNSYRTNPARTAVKIGAANAAVFADVVADGIDITTSNITVQNISIQAAPSAVATGNYNYGVYLHNSTSAVLTHDIINHITATGFSYCGLCMQGWNTSVNDSAGFSNVLIENSSFFGNQVSGIFAAAGDDTGNEFQPEFPGNLYLNSNLTIKNCQTYNNAGFNAALDGVADGNQINSGNSTSGGIFISSVDGAIVENSTAYNNSFASNGGVGIWAFDATRVVFQKDDSYDNKTNTFADGDGFDFDHGVTYSTMQYDYSHGNQGAAFLLATTGGSSNNNGDTIRFCIGDDNGSGIYIETPPDVPLLGTTIYNNTVLSNGITVGAPNVDLAIAGDSTASDTVTILNNIFFSSGSAENVLITAPEPQVQIDRNDYWVAGAAGDFSVYFNGSVLGSVADWSNASVGYEVLGGKSVALVQDPLLGNEQVSDLPTAVGLAIKRDSPLRSLGLNLTSQQWRAVIGNIGKVNFFGRPINRHSIGAG